MISTTSNQICITCLFYKNTYYYNSCKLKTNKLAGAENVVVIARNTDKAAQLFPNNEVRHGDCEDKSSITDALKENNIKFVAYTSFPDAQNSTTPLAADHRLTENAIKEAGIDHSFLRDNWYLENEIGFLQSGAANRDALY